MSAKLSSSVFSHPRPNFTAEEVKLELERDFGLRGEPQPLVGDRDQNWRVQGAHGNWVVKIAHALEDRALLELQNACLAHLQAVDPALGVPRLIASRAGEDMVTWVRNDTPHAVRVLTHLPGELFASCAVSTPLLASLGGFMGRVSRALQGFAHPAAHRGDFLWNLDAALQVAPWVEEIEPPHRELVARVFERYRERVQPRLKHLRMAVLHQDAHDHNLLVTPGATPQVTGLLDFGDMSVGHQINELAVTLAYALMGQEDLWSASRALIGAYAEAFPIRTEEADVLFDLAAARLAMSVCISTHRAHDFPDNDYLLISRTPALALLQRLDALNPDLLAARARDAAGLPPVPPHDAVVAWLGSDACRPASLFDFDLACSARLPISLAPGAPGMQHAGNPQAHARWLRTELDATGARFAIGNYGERRDGVYRGDQFASPASPERRTQHLGIDLFVPAGTTLHAPLDGRVLSVTDNALPDDYGPTLILEHRTGADGPAFWTLYGHLARDVLEMLQPGQEVHAGQLIGHIGDIDENGGWAPHVHFQIIADRLGFRGDFPGAGEPSLWALWHKISPDPNLLLRLAPESFRADPAPPEALIARRKQVLAPSLSLSYARKLKIVRGRGAWLYDHTGRAYLDGVNNICHVGHAHPHVVEALARQAAILNTNTRYLHDTILDYVERLAATFPDPLSVVYLVCSGSEANELALRIARTVTGRRHTIALDWGYHGNTNAALEVSAYKFNRVGGQGKPDHVELATLPDPYRGPIRDTSAEAGRAYAQSVAEQIERIREATGEGPATFIAEAISGCGGQVVFPDGYLGSAAQHVRDAGGMVIVDEVQTGFGRVGDAMWAHSAQGVVPDIVTLGKPIGNGHPMAAVVTTPVIAEAFANGMEFFSSFGGNPVSCAVGMAVLDVIEREHLQDNARQTGAYLKSALADLATRHRLIGDVRGRGLFLGVELVRDRDTLEPATHEAAAIVNRMREHGVLLSTDGPLGNVLKIKPPMVFGRAEADLLLETLDAALAHLRPRALSHLRAD